MRSVFLCYLLYKGNPDNLAASIVYKNSQLKFYINWKLLSSRREKLRCTTKSNESPLTFFPTYLKYYYCSRSENRQVQCQKYLLRLSCFGDVPVRVSSEQGEEVNCRKSVDFCYSKVKKRTFSCPSFIVRKFFRLPFDNGTQKKGILLVSVTLLVARVIVVRRLRRIKNSNVWKLYAESIRIWWWNVWRCVCA